MTNLAGRTWKFGNDINTDLILPIEALLKPVDEQPAFVFEGVRPGWSKLVRPGDIIVGGSNFGAGSGRPAPRVLMQLGISAVIAETIPGLFFRNCINYGLIAIECEGVSAAFDEGDEACIELESLTIINKRTDLRLEGVRIPEKLARIVRAGGIFRMLEEEGYIEPQSSNSR